jgi:hypothetical protein
LRPWRSHGEPSVKILVAGVQAKPNSGFDYAFDTDDGGSWEGNAADRSIKVGPGLQRSS